jgi:hypothetical protein
LRGCVPPYLPINSSSLAAAASRRSSTLAKIQRRRHEASRFLGIFGSRLDTQPHPIADWKLLRVAYTIDEAKGVEELAARASTISLKSHSAAPD